MNDKPPTAIFAGYNRLFHEGMKLLVGESLSILDSVDSFEDALDILRGQDRKIDLVIGAPTAGIAAELNAISQITCEFQQTKIIALAPRIDQVMLDRLLQSGANGVLSSDISVTALLYSIEIVLLGERIVPTLLPSIGRARPAAEAAAQHIPGEPADLVRSLSAREREVLNCLVDGLPNKSIARLIGITEATVKVHVKMLLRKLGMQNRTQIAVWALDHGLAQRGAPDIDAGE